MVETKSKLIRYFKPIKTESLLSFLNRLSIVNKVSLSVLLRHIGYNHHIINNKYIINIQDYNEGIDNYINTAIVSNNKLDDIYKTSLENALNWTLSSEFKALRHLLRIENKRFTKFCPLCLKEQVIHKLHWQYEGMVICEEHETKMLSTCTYCNNKAHVEDIIIDRCRKCGNRFSELETSKKKYEIGYYREFVKEISAHSTLNRNNELSLSAKRYAFCVQFIITNYEIIKKNVRLNQDFYILLENELSDEKLIRLIELLLKDEGELIFQMIMHVATNSKLNQTGDMLSYGDKIIHSQTINDQSVILSLLDVDYEQLKLFGILNDERLDTYNQCFRKVTDFRDMRKASKKKIQIDNLVQMRNKHYIEVAKFRYNVIKPLLTGNSVRGAVGVRTKEVNDIINSNNEIMIKQNFGSNFYSTVTRRTISRWLERYVSSRGDMNSLIPNYHKSGGKGKIRFDKRIVEYIHDAMKSEIDNTSEKRNKNIYQKVCKQVKDYNEGADDQIVMPYFITISNYVDRNDSKM